MLIPSNSKAEITKVKAELKREFEMKDLGQQGEYWEWKSKGIERRRFCIYLKRHTSINLLKGLECQIRSWPIVTPIYDQFKLSVSQSPNRAEEYTYMESITYANIIGSIMYAMACTQPDIAHAISLVSKSVSNPGKAHWQALKWILRYIKGSLNW